MSARRVLFCIPSMKGGGAEQVFTTLLTHMDTSIVKASLCTIKDDGGIPEGLPPDIAVDSLGLKSHAKALPALVRFIRCARPEVVLSTHSHLNMLLGLARPLIPRSIRLIGRETAILSHHHLQFRIPALWDMLARLGYLGLDRILCQSSDMREDLISNYGVTPGKTLLLDNPVDAARVRRLAAKPDRHYSQFAVDSARFDGKDRTLLVAVGRLEPQKDFETLIRAFALLDDSTVHLIILGEGSERGKLESCVYELGLAGQVSLPGFAANPYPLMQSASLVVLSSRHEPFPNVLLEAGVLGTPVAALACPGAVRDIVEQGVTGLTVPSHSPQAMAGVIKKALSTTFHSEQIAARTEARFGLTATVPAYEQALSEG